MIGIPGQQSSDRDQFKQIKNFRFKTNTLLGKGNFSNVYPGINQLTNQSVAVKVIDRNSIKNPKLLQLHRNELDVLQLLHHPNCIRCLDVINSQTHCYIVTELCEGGDLDIYAKRKGFLSEEEAAPFLKDILDGLVYLASLNIIHRDLKVSNVFLQNKQAKIADFGFAVISKQKFEDLNIGSPLYMCPQGYIYNMYGPKTDVWAFGILIYELLHGDTPFSHCKLDTDLKKQLSFPFDRTKIKPTVSPDLREVILKCLQIMEARRISVYQLRQSNYFKRISQQLNPSLYQPIKFNEQTLIENNTSNDSTKKKSFDSMYGGQIKSPFHHIGQNKSPQLWRKPHQNQQIHHLHHLKPDFVRIGRPISTAKREEDPISPTKIRERFGSIDSKKPSETYTIFTPSITFKVAINILHYCRCMFRFSQLLIQASETDKQLKCLSGWILLVLQQLKRKINVNQILFQGVNKEVKADKLREVRTDYQRKYSDELKHYITGFINKPNLFEVRNFFFLLYRKYDFLLSKQKNPLFYQIGYFSVLLHDATRLLLKCQEQNNYIRYASYRDLEESLQWGKQRFTDALFENMRKRIVINK